MVDDEMQIVEASKKVEAQYVEMRVPLYSYGCEKKVKKALSHTRGIYSVKVDYYQQKVTVWGICNKFDVLATIKRKRKEARFWSPEDNNIVVEEPRPSTSDSQLPAFKPPPPPPPPSSSALMIRSTSFSWKAVKNVFSRSLSF